MEMRKIYGLGLVCGVALSGITGKVYLVSGSVKSCVTG